MPVNISGSTGITTPGVASDTMPTSGGDAVVESGSNSDGWWTRWADGTQITKTLGIGSTSGHVTKTLPAVFSDADFMITGNLQTGGNQTTSINVDNATTTTVELGAIASGSYVTGSQTIWGAIGRWK